MYPSDEGCAHVNGYAEGFESRARGANLSHESSVGCTGVRRLAVHLFTSWATMMLTVKVGRSETEYFVLAGLQRIAREWVGVSNDTSRYTQKHR